MARMPKPKPVNQMDVLEDVSDELRQMELFGLAGDIEAVHQCLACMLSLTRFGDVLFGDEIRNILGIRHNLRPRRGTGLDPMKGRRRDRRTRR
jgi:hypothetical protein